MIAIFESNPKLKEDWERAFDDSQISKYIVVTSDFDSALKAPDFFKFVIIDIGDSKMVSIIEKVKETSADICLVSDSYEKTIPFVSDRRIASLCLRNNMDQVVDWLRFMQHKHKMMGRFDDKWFSESFGELGNKLEPLLTEGT